MSTGSRATVIRWSGGRRPGRRLTGEVDHGASHRSGDLARPGPGGAPITWEAPLIGRQAELDFIGQARRRGQVRGIVLAGGQGVGKTRLAEEAAAAGRQDGWAAERVTGAGAGIRLAAFGHLLPRAAISARDPLVAILATVDYLAAQAAERPMVLHVDEVRQLDPASVELVHMLAHLPRIFLLLTVRSDEPAPPSLVDLWKDGLAHRLEVRPLGWEATYQMVRAVLGGEVEPATFGELWNASLGNPLYLRELLLAAVEGGALRRVGGRWRGPAMAAPSRRLTEIVQARLDRLDRPERVVLDTLAVGGALDLDLLDRAVDYTALASVADRGLVLTSEAGGVTVVDLAHPVYRSVLRQRVGIPRGRAIRRALRELVAARDGTGRPALQRADLIRAALWRLDDGEPIAAEQLIAAAEVAAGGYPYALAEQLAGAPAMADGQTELGGPDGAGGWLGHRPSCHDGLLVAARLAGAAWRAERSLPAGLALAAVQIALGRAAEAEAVLAEVDGAAQRSQERVQVALVRASLLHRLGGNPTAATAALTAVEAALAAGPQADALACLRAGIALDVGQVRQAVTLATGLLARQPEEGRAAPAIAATLTLGLALCGRANEAVATAERYLGPALAEVRLAPAEVRLAPAAAGELMAGRILAERWLGRLPQAEALARTCYRPAAEAGSAGAMATFGGLLGLVLLDQGRLLTAAGWLRESVALLRERDSSGYRPWTLALLAMAAGQRGDAMAAEHAAAEAEAACGRPRFFHSDLLVGRAWQRAAVGDLSGALVAVQRAAALASSAGLSTFAAVALHTAVRLGDPRRAAAGLVRLAAETATPMMAAYASHAAALARHDGGGLDQVAAEFARQGAVLLAAEAAAQATAAHRRRGAVGAALRSATGSRQLAQECQGARTPALHLAVRTPVLTAREHEIAALVAEGLASKQIADRLTLSVRTVDNHLYRIYRKLGVSDRGGLAAALA